VADLDAAAVSCLSFGNCCELGLVMFVVGRGIFGREVVDQAGVVIVVSKLDQSMS
jgi:hypothetical protein